MSTETKNIINVHVTPKSGRDVLCGVEADTLGNALLKVKVTASPNVGEANIAVCRLIAKSVGVPKSFVTVKRGHKSRYKQIEISCESKKFDS